MQSNAIRFNEKTNGRKLISDKNLISSPVKWWSSCCFLALAKPQLPRGPLPNLSLKNIISLYFYHPKPSAKQILSVHKACTKQTRTNFPPLQLTSLKWLGYSCKVAVAHQSLEVSYRTALATFPTANIFFSPPGKYSILSVSTPPWVARAHLCL